MKYKIKLKGLCCANCAAKIEEKVSKLKGVESANVSFITEKMVICADETVFSEIKDNIEKIVHKIEPDVEIEYL